MKSHDLGAHVYAVSRTQSDLDKLKNDLGSGVTCIQLDIADWKATDQKISQIKDATGLVNNAAVAMCAPCLEAPESDFDKMFDVNVKGMMHVSQIIGKSMVERGVKGSIVNLSSQASMAALEDHLIYGMTKAAVDMMTKIMALELGPKQVNSC